MTVYRVQGPDGRTYKVEGPEGATADELGAFIQSQSVSPEPAQFGMEDYAPKTPQPATYDRARAVFAPVFEGGAAIVGGVLGAPLGPIGAAGGAGLGYGIGKELTGLADMYIGGKKVPVGPMRTLQNVAEGSVYEMGGQMLGPALQATARGAGKLTSNVIGNLGTHTGGENIEQLAQAGYAGGERARIAKASLRGEEPMNAVLQDAKAALDVIRADRGAAYRTNMAAIATDKTVLDFMPIESAASSAMKVATFKGKSINRSAAEVQRKIGKIIDEWRNANPSEYHTVEGMDALKRTIGDIRDSTEFGKPERVVADRIYNAIKDQIVKQAPGYSTVMKDYETASNMVKEIERAFSLGDKASADSAMRKLQSLARNNANTNYGSRLELAKQLEQQGGGNVLDRAAGQAMSSFTPRGLGSLQAGATGYAGIKNPAFLAALPFQSPRLMGEAALFGGEMAGKIGRGTNILLNRARLRDAAAATASNMPRAASLGYLLSDEQ